MWRLEGSLRYWLLSPTLFEAGSLIVFHCVPHGPVSLQRSSCLSLSSLTWHPQITAARHSISSACVLGIQTPVLMFIQQVCYSLSHLPKPERF